MRSLEILLKYSINKDSNKEAGMFLIPYINENIFFQVIASNDSDNWEHVSFVMVDKDRNCLNQYPDYIMTRFIKKIFFKPTENAIQIFPDEENYINNHSYCFHLWNHKDLIFPDSIKIGLKKFNIK